MMERPGSFEQDLAAILGEDSGRAFRRGRTRLLFLVFAPLMVLTGVMLVAFAQREERAMPPAVALHVDTGPPPAMSVQVKETKPAPRMAEAKPVPPPIVRRVATKTARVDPRPERRSRRREAMAEVSYTPPSAAMFAQAQDAPAPEKQKMEERDIGGTVDIEADRKRVARLAAQDAVRSLRLH